MIKIINSSDIVITISVKKKKPCTVALVHNKSNVHMAMITPIRL